MGTPAYMDKAHMRGQNYLHSKIILLEIKSSLTITGQTIFYYYYYQIIK